MDKINKLFLTSILTLAMFAVTPIVHAQAGDVDPLRSLSPKICTNLSNDLRLTSRDASTGGQVSDLQFFLQSNGNLNLEPTGYFGLMTFGAVQRYQLANRIVPASGFVGPITRASINASSCQTPIIVQNTDIVPAVSTLVVPAETRSKITLITPDGGLFGTGGAPPVKVRWSPKKPGIVEVGLIYAGKLYGESTNYVVGQKIVLKNYSNPNKSGNYRFSPSLNEYEGKWYVQIVESETGATVRTSKTIGISSKG